MIFRRGSLKSAVIGLAVIGASFLGFTGCGGEFEQKSELKKYRVLGIRADRPEPEADARVTLRVVDFVPESVGQKIAFAQPPTYAWRACLLPLGSQAAFACADPRFEVPLSSTGPEAVLDLGPGGLDLSRLLAATELAGQRLPDLVPIQLTVLSGHESIGTVETVKLLYVRHSATDDERAANTNPTLLGLTVAGELGCDEDLVVEDCLLAAPAGSRLSLELTLAPGAAEACHADDLEAGRCPEGTGVEDLLVSWYSNVGELESAVTLVSDDTSSNVIGLPTRVPDGYAKDEPVLVRIYAVVRDGRGGLDYLHAEFTMTPSLL